MCWGQYSIIFTFHPVKSPDVFISQNQHFKPHSFQVFHPVYFSCSTCCVICVEKLRLAVFQWCELPVKKNARLKIKVGGGAVLKETTYPIKSQVSDGCTSLANKLKNIFVPSQGITCHLRGDGASYQRPRFGWLDGLHKWQVTDGEPKRRFTSSSMFLKC